MSLTPYASCFRPASGSSPDRNEKWSNNWNRRIPFEKKRTGVKRILNFQTGQLNAKCQNCQRSDCAR
jgi:hypothetical protein